MSKVPEWKKKLLSKRLLEDHNSLLLYGKEKDTEEVLQFLYEEACARKHFLCTSHDADTVREPRDFFDSVFKTKYGEDYLEKDRFNILNEWLENPWEGGHISDLVELCQPERKREGEEQTHALFCIKGMEKFLFRMDYGYLSAEELKQLRQGQQMGRELKNFPRDRNFGNSLRAELHQTHRGIFVGTVQDVASLEYCLTLGAYSYLFYAENFMPCWLER